MKNASIYEELTRAVVAARSEQAQVSGTARVLAAMGYSGAGKPEVHETTVDRSTFRVYVWRDSPFGDHLVLATGPTFTPKLALASEIPASGEVGVYVRAVIRGDVRTLAGAGRAASRAATRASAAEERSRSSASREDERRAATARQREAEERRREEARQAEAARRAAAEAARSRGREKARAHAAEERSRAPDMNRAMEQAQALIAALRAAKGR